MVQSTGAPRTPNGRKTPRNALIPVLAPELGTGNFFHTVMSMTAEFTPEKSKA